MTTTLSSVFSATTFVSHDSGRTEGADLLLGGACAEAIGEMSEKLKGTVRDFYERGWNRGDLSVIDELFAPEYEDHDAAAQTGRRGPDAASQFIETFRAAVPDLAGDHQERDGGPEESLAFILRLAGAAPARS